VRNRRGQTAGTDDVEAGGLVAHEALAFYTVRAVNFCEWERP